MLRLVAHLPVRIVEDEDHQESHSKEEHEREDGVRKDGHPHPDSEVTRYRHHYGKAYALAQGNDTEGDKIPDGKMADDDLRCRCQEHQRRRRKQRHHEIPRDRPYREGRPLKETESQEYKVRRYRGQAKIDKKYEPAA